jgi:hypothetical protein
MDTVPGNTELISATLIDGTVYTSVRSASKGTIDAIVNPYNFNPLATFGSRAQYPVGLRYLMLDDVNVFLAPVKAASISTNVIDTGIDYYRIVRPNQQLDAGTSNLPTSYSNIYQTKVYVNGVEVAFTQVEDGGKFEIFSSTSYRTVSGKYKILLAEFPPLEDAEGNASVIKYVIERFAYPDWYQFATGDDPSTGEVETSTHTYEVLSGQPDRISGPDAWKNSNGSDTHIKANSIVEWNGSKWTMIFDPDDFETNKYITNLRTGIQYKWDGVQWLKSFEGEYLPGSWRLTLNP